jgi:hypothetical protein
VRFQEKEMRKAARKKYDKKTGARAATQKRGYERWEIGVR